jgi:hypothetical protein
MIAEPTGESMKHVKSRPESTHAAQSKRLLDRLCGGLAHQNHYIAGYEMHTGRQLAIERCAQGFYLWSEPCLERVPVDLQRAHLRAYAANEPRNADLNGMTASRLKRDQPADYWRFDTLGDVERFVACYAKL